MRCPRCGYESEVRMPFCANCGNQLNGSQTAYAVQPPARYPASAVLPQSPEGPRPRQPLTGMILGICAAVLSILAYMFIMINAGLKRRFEDTGWILMFLTLALAAGALVFSIIGMRRSVRTGGRKYVAGIVFSGVGSGTAAYALLFSFFCFILTDLFT